MEQKYKIHSFYILLILISIIVGLISVEWSKIPRLVDYITFALTVSSLILAVLAIVYSIYSNTSISSALGEISRAAKEVGQSAQNINQSNVELKKEVEKLPTRLDNVDKNISDTKNIVSSLTKKQEELAVESSDKVKVESAKILADEFVKKFLEQTSIIGLEVLLLVSLSKESTTSFNFDEFIESNKEYLGSKEYLYGFFIAASSMDLITYTTDAKNRFTISYVHEQISKNIKSLCKERIISSAKRNVQDTDSNEKETIERWLKSYFMIGEYFNIKLS